MLTTEELKIVDLFRCNIFSEYTIMELMKRLSKSSYTWTYNAVGKLRKLNIIKTRQKGQSTLCSINLDEQKALAYLSLLDEIETYSKKRLPIENVRELIASLPISFFTFVVTGSYAEGKQTPKSDLDVAVLVEDGVSTKKMLAYLLSKGMTMIPEIHPYVFSRSEFLQMLLDKQVNYGKLLFNKRLIAFGAENYYSVIREAINHGFKG